METCCLNLGVSGVKMPLVAPRGAAFLLIKYILRWEAEKPHNFLALHVKLLFSLLSVSSLSLSSRPLHKGECFNLFPSQTDLFLIPASKGLNLRLDVELYGNRPFLV